MARKNSFWFILIFITVLLIAGVGTLIYFKRIKNRSSGPILTPENMFNHVNYPFGVPFIDNSGMKVDFGVSRYGDLSKGDSFDGFVIVGVVEVVPYRINNYYYTNIAIPEGSTGKKTLKIKLGREDVGISVGYAKDGVYPDRFTVKQVGTVAKDIKEWVPISVRIITEHGSMPENCEGICRENRLERETFGPTIFRKLNNPKLLKEGEEIMISANTVIF